MRRLPALLRAACSVEIACTSVKVSLVVGTMLNLVNQGAAVIAGGAIAWAPALMNFVVPYCVSSYGAAANAVRGQQGKRHHEET